MTLKSTVRDYERSETVRSKPAPARAAAARARIMDAARNVGRRNDRNRCAQTLPLFPLWLILDADGTLTEDMRGVVDRTQA